MEPKTYPIEEAIKEVKKASKEKFDASVEAHFRLGIDISKSDQQVRDQVALPHGTGKTLRIAVFTTKVKEAKDARADLVGGKELIDEILKSGKCDFDVALATPDMMKDLAKAGKILGPKGLMPNPKDGTVTQDIAKAIRELKKGKAAFKTDAYGIIHQAIGKVSFDDKKLIENFRTLYEAIVKAKPQGVKGEYVKSITLASSMGPGVRVKVTTKWSS